MILTLLFTHGTAAVLGLALGCWYKAHDKIWQERMKKMQYKMSLADLREAEELHAAAILRHVIASEMQASEKNS